MNGRRILRLLGRGLLSLVGLEVLYLFVANAVLFSGTIQRWVSFPPENVSLSWDFAWSPWPGRAYVDGFSLQIQDPGIRFHLTIQTASIDVVLHDLLRRQFHTSWVRADGVAFRLIPRPDPVPANTPREAVFAPLDDFAPVDSAPASPPSQVPDATPPGPFELVFDDVDVAVSELWILEYRYRGTGRASGTFTLTPGVRANVGPAVLVLEGGKLSAGAVTIAPDFRAHADVKLGPVDFAAAPGLAVVGALTTSIHFDTSIEDFSVAELYGSDLRVRGTGRLAAALELARGRIQSGSRIQMSISDGDVLAEAYRFTGAADATLSFFDDARAPRILASLAGALQVPLPLEEPVDAGLTEVTADLRLVNGDLAHGLRLDHLDIDVGKVRVNDARPVTRLVAKYVPIIAGFVLGDGPLVASGSAAVTPTSTVIRLHRLQLGDAALEGAATPGPRGWSGAAAGHFGRIPLGLRLKRGTVESALFVPGTWLRAELRHAGIPAD